MKPNFPGVLCEVAFFHVSVLAVKSSSLLLFGTYFFWNVGGWPRFCSWVFLAWRCDTTRPSSIGFLLKISLNVSQTFFFVKKDFGSDIFLKIWNSVFFGFEWEVSQTVRAKMVSSVPVRWDTSEIHPQKFRSHKAGVITCHHIFRGDQRIKPRKGMIQFAGFPEQIVHEVWVGVIYWPLQGCRRCLTWRRQIKD